MWLLLKKKLKVGRMVYCVVWCYCRCCLGVCM